MWSLDYIALAGAHALTYASTRRDREKETDRKKQTVRKGQTVRKETDRENHGESPESQRIKDREKETKTEIDKQK